MDPIWQHTESIPFMKPTLHVNQTKLMAMMSPKWDPSASILWGPLPSLLTHAHEVDDKHMTCSITNTSMPFSHAHNSSKLASPPTSPSFSFFFLLSTIIVYSPHWRVRTTQQSYPLGSTFEDHILKTNNHYFLRWSIIDNIFPGINNKMSPQQL